MDSDEMTMPLVVSLAMFGATVGIIVAFSMLAWVLSL